MRPLLDMLLPSAWLLPSIPRPPPHLTPLLTVQAGLAHCLVGSARLGHALA